MTDNTETNIANPFEPPKYGPLHGPFLPPERETEEQRYIAESLMNEAEGDQATYQLMRQYESQVEDVVNADEAGFDKDDAQARLQFIGNAISARRAEQAKTDDSTGEAQSQESQSEEGNDESWRAGIEAARDAAKQSRRESFLRNRDQNP